MKERGNYWLRILDRYCGIPFLYLLSLIKRRKKRTGKKIKRVLVIKIGSIGDTILLIPILKSIKESYKNVSLEVICSRNNYEVLNRYSFINNLIIFEISNVVKKPFYLFNFIRDINIKEYDIIIDFEQWSRITSILTFLIKSEYKIGFKTKGESKHLLFNSFVPHRSTYHEKDNYVSLVNSIGVSVNDKNIGFPMLPYEIKFVEDLFKKEGISGNNLILLNPWSSGYKGYLKEWGINNFINIAKILISGGYKIGIVGTADNESQGIDIVRKCGNNVISFCGKLSLGQTACLIKKSLLLITINTGVMHLGAALNHPMIALHGPAGVLRWGPISSSSNIYNIQSDIKCAPCLNLGFEYKCKNGGCMDLIGVNTVIERINDCLKENYIRKENLLGMGLC